MTEAKPPKTNIAWFPFDETSRMVRSIAWGWLGQGKEEMVHYYLTGSKFLLERVKCSEDGWWRR